MSKLICIKCPPFRPDHWSQDLWNHRGMVVKGTICFDKKCMVRLNIDRNCFEIEMLNEDEYTVIGESKCER